MHAATKTCAVRCADGTVEARRVAVVALKGGGEQVLMADFIQVDPADLLISGRRVDCHAADMHAAHTAADARIDGALPPPTVPAFGFFGPPVPNPAYDP